METAVFLSTFFKGLPDNNIFFKKTTSSITPKYCYAISVAIAPTLMRQGLKRKARKPPLPLLSAKMLSCCDKLNY